MNNNVTYPHYKDKVHRGQVAVEYICGIRWHWELNPEHVSIWLGKTQLLLIFTCEEVMVVVNQMIQVRYTVDASHKR